MREELVGEMGKGGRSVRLQYVPYPANCLREKSELSHIEWSRHRNTIFVLLQFQQSSPLHPVNVEVPFKHTHTVYVFHEEEEENFLEYRFVVFFSDCENILFERHDQQVIWSGNPWTKRGEGEGPRGADTWRRRTAQSKERREPVTADHIYRQHRLLK